MFSPEAVNRSEYEVLGNYDSQTKVVISVKRREPLFVYGPQGVGKRTFVMGMLAALGYEPTLVMAGNSEYVTRIVRSMHLGSTEEIFGKSALVIDYIEEFERFSKSERKIKKKVYNVLEKIILDSQIPIIVIGTIKPNLRGRYAASWSKVYRACRPIEFKPLDDEDMRTFLKEQGVSEDKWSSLLERSDGIPKHALELSANAVIIESNQVYYNPELLRIGVVKSPRLALMLADHNKDFYLPSFMGWAAWNIQLATRSDPNITRRHLDLICRIDAMKHQGADDKLKFAAFLTLPRRGGMGYPKNPGKLWAAQSVKDVNDKSAKSEEHEIVRSKAKTKPKRRSKKKTAKKGKDKPKTPAVEQDELW